MPLPQNVYENQKVSGRNQNRKMDQSFSKVKSQVLTDRAFSF